MSSIACRTYRHQSAPPMSYFPERQQSPFEPALPIRATRKRQNDHLDVTPLEKRCKTAPSLPPTGPFSSPCNRTVRSRSLLPRTSISKLAPLTTTPRSAASSWRKALSSPNSAVTSPHIAQFSPRLTREPTVLPSFHTILELVQINCTPIRLNPISSSPKPMLHAPLSPTRQTIPLTICDPCESPFVPNYTYRASFDGSQHCTDSLELAQSLIQLSRTTSQHISNPIAIPLSSRDISKQTLSYNSSPGSSLYSHSYSPHSAHHTPISSRFLQPLTDRISAASTNLPSIKIPTSHDNFEPPARPAMAGLSLPLQEHRTPSVKYAPITPPSAKTEIVRYKSHHHAGVKRCLSCNLDQSPCWRPSWLIKDGQLCNSCGLRYKKTQARCLNMKCKKVPAKGEWAFMQSKGTVAFSDGNNGYSCLECTSKVIVGENGRA